MTAWIPVGGPGPLVCAHRGASAHAPENTVAAAQLAVDVGASWIEFDVRPCADALVVHHDPVTSDGVRIADAPLASLDGVPSFAAFVEACGPMGLDVEMKTDDIGIELQAFIELVATEIDRRRAGRGHDAVLVTSFDQAALDGFRGHRPDIATGVLFHDRTASWAIERAVEHGHAAVVPWYPLVTDELVADAKSSELAVLTWTVNEPDHARAVVAAGVDVVIGDDPEFLQQLLAR